MTPAGVVSSSLHATRQEFLGAAAACLVAAPGVASAAKYGSFGAGSPEVLNPKEVDIDAEVLRSGPVQSALSKIKGYQQVVTQMKATLASDDQANLRSVINKDLDIGALRASLNTVNGALDEDAQRGTDRLIRVILQDITELDIANTQKEGITRSPRRLEILQNKLAKLDQALTDYLAFFA